MVRILAQQHTQPPWQTTPLTGHLAKAAEPEYNPSPPALSNNHFTRSRILDQKDYQTALQIQIEEKKRRELDEKMKVIDAVISIQPDFSVERKCRKSDPNASKEVTEEQIKAKNEQWKLDLKRQIEEKEERRRQEAEKLQQEERVHELEWEKRNTPLPPTFVPDTLKQETAPPRRMTPVPNTISPLPSQPIQKYHLKSRIPRIKNRRPIAMDFTNYIVPSPPKNDFPRGPKADFIDRNVKTPYKPDLKTARQRVPETAKKPPLPPIKSEGKRISKEQPRQEEPPIVRESLELPKDHKRPVRESKPPRDPSLKLSKTVDPASLQLVQYLLKFKDVLHSESVRMSVELGL